MNKQHTASKINTAIKAILSILTILISFMIPLSSSQAQGWVIVAWSGDVADFPAGYQLCDGSNGTPDLRDRFIVGAGRGYVLSATGGVITNSLSHRHKVEAHVHAISTSNLDHTHSLPLHAHALPTHSHTVLSHSHPIPSHSHAINNQTQRFYLSLRGPYASRARLYAVGVNTSTSFDQDVLYTIQGGSETVYTVLRWTDEQTHNHGGQTATWNGQTASSGGYTSYNGGGSTSEWSGTSGSMSTNSTHNHGGETGSMSPLTDYTLLEVENRPPYYAVYYICAPASNAGIRSSDPYTFTVSSGTVIDVSRQFTYGEIAIISLLVLLIVIVMVGMFWFAIAVR